MASNEKNVKNEKLVAGLSYILIGIIWYFVDDKIKKSEFAKFHVKQGINLIIVMIFLSMCIALLNTLTFGILFLIYQFITGVFTIFFLILLIIAIVNVLNHEKKEVLIIGQFANRYLKF